MIRTIDACRLKLGTLLAAVVALAVSFAPRAGSAADPAVEEELESLKEEIESEEGESPDAGTDASNRESRPDASVGDRDTSSKRDARPSAPGAGSSREDADRREGASRSVESRGGDSAEEATGFFANWELYRDPLLCGFIAGAILGLLGVYVVSRRIVFVSAALSQVSALGIALGFVLVATAGISGVLGSWIPPVLAVLLSLAVVFALVRAGDDPSFPRDAVLGTAFVVPMALVLVIGPYMPQEMHEIQAILHGSAVVVRTSDLWAVGIAGAAILVTQMVAFRGFVFASLDPNVARTQGLPVDALEGVLLGSIALMTGLATRALGALPTFALTVLPAVGALRLKIGLTRVFALAAVLGGCSGAVGYWVAYHFGWSVGASQTLVAAAAMVSVRGVGGLFD